MAVVTQTIQDQVAELYIGFFGRAADAAGFGYWANELATGKVTPQKIADDFAKSPEFVSMYDGLTPTQQVTRAYQNVLNRAPDAPGLAYWVNELTHGTSIGTVVWQIVNAAFVQQGTADGLLVQNKVAVSQYFAINLASNDIDVANVAFIGVTSDPATVAAKEAELSGLVGKTYVLTTSVDTIVATGTHMDTVKGIVGNASETTLTLLDSITGNGKTTVEIGVSSNFAGGDAQYVTMTGVNALKVVNANTGAVSLTMDASTYGKDISNVTLQGLNSLHLHVDNLTTLQDNLSMNIASGTSGIIHLRDATVNDMALNASLDASAGATGANSVTVGAVGVDVQVAKNTDAVVALSQTASAAASAAVGDFVISDINVVAAKSAGDTSVRLNNYATSTVKGSATVGDLVTGDIAITIGGENAVKHNYLTITNSAVAASGAATAGDIALGSVMVDVGNSGSFSFTADNVAHSTKGNATVGQIVLGDVDYVVGDAGYVWVSMMNSVDATTSGNASTGGIVAGDLSMAAGDDAYVGYSLENYADADKGNATLVGTTLGNVDVAMGNQTTNDGNDDAWVYVSNWARVNNTGNVAIGDSLIGNVSVELGDNAELGFQAYNFADNNGKGSATVGDLAVGDIAVNLGVNASANRFTITNSAQAASGAATVGDVTLGTVSFDIAKSASVSFTANNQAYSTKGDATVGQIALGDVDYVIGDGGYVWMSMMDNADATTTGDASTGGIVAGDLTSTAGKDAYVGYSLENYAYADKGDATVGNNTVGDINIAMGGQTTLDNNEDVWVYVSNYAEVRTSGAAVAGDVLVGDVAITMGDKSSAEFYAYNFARNYAAGTVELGTLTVGNIDVSVGASGSIYGSVENWLDARGTSTGIVGDVNVGNITLTAGAAGYVGFGVSAACANTAQDVAIGNVTVGNVTLTVGNSGSASYWQYVQGASVADVVVGDVTYNLGVLASVDDFGIRVGAATGNVGNVTVGNLTFNGATGAFDDLGWWVHGVNVDAAKDVGDVTIGNVAISGATSAAFDQIEMNVVAGQDIGNVLVGDVTLAAAKNGTADFVINVTADRSIASFDLGAVGLSSVGNGADTSLTVNVETDGRDVNSVTIGNIDLAATGANASAAMNLLVTATTGDILGGVVSVGDIATTARGNGADAALTLNFHADAVALVDVGNIDISLGTVDTATTSAVATVTVNTDGALTVGDITLTADNNVTTSFAASATVVADVNLTAVGDLHVGNIRVSGGYSNSTTVADNFGVLTNWLSLTATGDVYVGNIDYSGYESSATIDFSTWKGVSEVKAAQGDTDITLNTTKNIVTLYGGDDNVDMNTGYTLKADANVISKILGFTSSGGGVAVDTITVDTAGTDFTFNGSQYGQTYAMFLANAEAANQDVYAQRIGSDVYVAFDYDNGNAVDSVIKLVGITSVAANDFVLV